ncbi:glycoside hydrolase family 97 protein [Pseudoduganella danionis]|uniref:Glycoside hydrolase family 97 protein n=1 Tax=Pseudoduganella danionis TaxID=1890295 RepID=A0ABW9SI15_9BURK|nr:glycoside hydrolase family 97 protein [Pseudoduganella danionis]MTW31742.1 glycoside hydrolase family 97 protein [Pseudoduganella danionis]
MRSELQWNKQGSALLLAAVALVCGQVQGKEVSVSSPDGKLTVIVSDEHGTPDYRVQYAGKEIMPAARLGLVLRDGPELGEGYTIAASRTADKDETWQQPWGERRLVRDHHRELLVELARGGKTPRKFALRLRVFDDGLGFRYEVPRQRGVEQVEISDERTEFRFADSAKARAWWIPARYWRSYEALYQKTALHDAPHVETPFTVRLASGVHLALHEAALTNYASMTLNQRREGVFKADLTPWSDGSKVKLRAPFNTPWRTVQVAPDAAGLLNSDLILNLNEPNKLGDVSWVKPGKYVGIWWGMHLWQKTWASGDKHGATTAEVKRYMDFAAKYGFTGVLAEGWNVGWDGDWPDNGEKFKFSQPYPDFDMAAVAAYGRSKGVKLIGHHETSGAVSHYASQMGAAYDYARANNIDTIKTGYVADNERIKRIDANGQVRYEWHDGQFMAAEYLRSVTEAAKRHIAIDTHEPIKDTGLRRTYPNWLSREGARGQEYNAWGYPPNPPEHTAILPYTRMLSGPFDYTPGIFNLEPNGKGHENRVRSTLAKELSLYVVLYSPVQMAADLIENYEARPDAFQFIADVPTDWEQSRALAGEVGEYVVMARQQRGGADWYLGALTNERARDVQFKLDFLDPQRRYQAQIYRDGAAANWETAPYDLVIEQREVRASDVLALHLAAGGGAAIRFKVLD